jgi:hypothetical protein
VSERASELLWYKNTKRQKDTLFRPLHDGRSNVDITLQSVWADLDDGLKRYSGFPLKKRFVLSGFSR